jgi:hypothetical protein
MARASATNGGGWSADEIAILAQSRRTLGLARRSRSIEDEAS